MKTEENDREILEYKHGRVADKDGNIHAGRVIFFTPYDDSGQRTDKLGVSIVTRGSNNGATAVIDKPDCIEVVEE